MYTNTHVKIFETPVTGTFQTVPTMWKVQRMGYRFYLSRKGNRV